MSIAIHESPRFVPFIEQGWCFRDDGELMALKTGGDFCAEHEQGIDPIIRGLFKIARPTLWERVKAFFAGNKNALHGAREGIDAHRVTSQGASRVYSFELRGCVVLVVLGECVFSLSGVDTFDQLVRRLGDSAVDVLDRAKPRSVDEPAAVGWSKTTLVIAAEKGSLYARGLKAIADSAREGTLILGGALADQFMREKGGIGLYRESVIDAGIMERGDAVIRADQAHRRRLLAVSQREGLDALKASLRESGKSWFCLCPHSFDSDGVLVYWLNPMDQQAYATGGFTIDELRLWLKDEGPVIRSKDD